MKKSVKKARLWYGRFSENKSGLKISSKSQKVIKMRKNISFSILRVQSSSKNTKITKKSKKAEKAGKRPKMKKSVKKARLWYRRFSEYQNRVKIGCKSWKSIKIDHFIRNRVQSSSKIKNNLKYQKNK